MNEFLTDTKSGKEFRLQNAKIHLTYKSHIPPEAWLSWLTKIKNIGTDKYSIVHEKGDSSVPYDHTHILIDFGYTFQTKNAKYFDWKLPNGEVIHPNIKIVKTAVHWKRCVLYHYKESIPYTNIQKPESENQIKEIWKHNTLSDALLSTCSTLKNVGGVIAAFNCKPSDYGIEPEVNWKPWQKEILDEIEQTPDSRHITWYYDPFGNAGKTFIAKHLGQYRGAFISTKANTYHVATAIDEFLKQNGSNSILVVIFNFSRQQENHKIYQALEELKDGLMTSEKYKGRTMFFPNPHLLCMANYIPDISSMSKDRWDIRTLQNDRVVKRYLGGKVVFEDPSIDPLIKLNLEEIDRAYSITNQFNQNMEEKIIPKNPVNSPTISSPPIKKTSFKLKKVESKIESKVDEVPLRSLNIKGPVSLASRGTAAPPQAAAQPQAASQHPLQTFTKPQQNNISKTISKTTNGVPYKIPPLPKIPNFTK